MAIHIDKLEKRWIFMVAGIVVMAWGIQIYYAAKGWHPPSNVEVIDSAQLHLETGIGGGEFSEQEIALPQGEAIKMSGHRCFHGSAFRLHLRARLLRFCRKLYSGVNYSVDQTQLSGEVCKLFESRDLRVELFLSYHLYNFDCTQCSGGRIRGFKPQHWPDPFLDETMILFNNIVEIFGTDS